jgi:hypothetical protein
VLGVVKDAESTPGQPNQPTCIDAAAAAACSAASAARDDAELAAAEYAAARCEDSMAAADERMAMCARSRSVGMLLSRGSASTSAIATDLEGCSTCEVAGRINKGSSLVCLPHMTSGQLDAR